MAVFTSWAFLFANGFRVSVLSGPTAFPAEAPAAQSGFVMRPDWFVSGSDGEERRSPAEAERRRSSRLRRVWLRHASLRVSRDILHAGRTSRFFGYERVRGASGMFFPLFQKIRRSGSGSAQSVRFQKVLTRYVSMIWNLSIHNMGFPGTFKNRKAPLPASFPFPAFFPLFRFFCWDSFRFFPFRFHSIDSCVRRLRQTPFFQASRRRAWRFSLPVLAHTL